MLKNNLFLNNQVSLVLQEEPIDFFFLDIKNGGFLQPNGKQLIMSENTRDKFLEELVINDDPETASNTLIADNLDDGFVYMGDIYENLEVDKDGDIYVKCLNGIHLVQVE